jgi:hypothetical protein
MERVERNIQKELLLLDIGDLNLRQFAFLYERKKLRDLIFFSVPEKMPHPFHSGYRVRFYLGITTSDNHQGFWIGSEGPSDQLSGLEVSPMGDGTGVDNDNIRPFSERDNAIPLLL